MSVGGGVEADLVALAGLPVVVETAEPSVDFQVVESDVGKDLLLDSGGVGPGLDSVLETQGFELFVAVEAVLDGLRNLIAEALDQVNELLDVGDRGLGGFIEHLTDEDHDLVSSGVVDAGDDSRGVGQLVLLEEAVECLLENFFVSGVGSAACAAEDLVSIISCFEAHFIVVTTDPHTIEISKFFVYF